MGGQLRMRAGVHGRVSRVWLRLTPWVAVEALCLWALARTTGDSPWVYLQATADTLAWLLGATLVLSHSALWLTYHVALTPLERLRSDAQWD